jgi:hypothetical protein
LDELTEEDMAARIAADRLRTAWLKERQTGASITGEALQRKAACSSSFWAPLRASPMPLGAKFA